MRIKKIWQLAPRGGAHVDSGQPSRSRRRGGLFALAVLGCVCLPGKRCFAEAFTLGDVWQDTKLYFTAPIRWDARDWMYFGGTVAAVGVAHEFDDNVRRHFATDPRTALNGKDKNSIRDAIPAAAVVAGTWLAATVIGEPEGRYEAYTMLEAAGFTAVTTEALKFAAGRSRPNETVHVDAWRKGGSSFPSLHASAAFAIGTVLAESGNDDYRWLRRFMGYGLAAGTAYIRLHDNVHWTSDVVAGAAIGIATARFTLNRRDAHTPAWSLSVGPTEDGGTMLSFNIPLH